MARMIPSSRCRTRHDGTERGHETRGADFLGEGTERELDSVVVALPNLLGTVDLSLFGAASRMVQLGCFL